MRVSFPATTVLIDGRIYVDEVQSSALYGKGLRRGMELLTVNGIPADEYGRSRIMPYVSSSTPQWTLHKTFEENNLLRGKACDTLNLVFSHRGKRLALSHVLGSAQRDMAAKYETLGFQRGKDGIGYLRIRDFMASDIRDRFDSIYPQLLTTTALVIDIRGNAGVIPAMPTIFWFTCRKTPYGQAPWSSPMYIPAYASWRMQLPDYKSPSGYMYPAAGKKTYDRPVAVLVDGGTFSAAEDFCSLFKCSGRGAVIGTRTGGSTGNGVRVELIPGHSYANICAKHDLMPDGTDFVGAGIIPDMEQNYESYFKDRANAVLRAAVKYLLRLSEGR